MHTLTDIFLEEYIINCKQQLSDSTELKSGWEEGRSSEKHYTCIFAMFKMCMQLFIYLVMAI